MQTIARSLCRRTILALGAWSRPRTRSGPANSISLGPALTGMRPSRGRITLFLGIYDEAEQFRVPSGRRGRARMVSSGGRNQYYQVPGVAEPCYSQVRKRDEPAR